MILQPRTRIKLVRLIVDILATHKRSVLRSYQPTVKTTLRRSATVQFIARKHFATSNNS